MALLTLVICPRMPLQGCDACDFKSTDAPSIMAFPDGFLFGSATSATQVEGAALEDGRSASIWDVAASNPGYIKDGSQPTVSADEYHRLKVRPRSRSVSSKWLVHDNPVRFHRHVVAAAHIQSSS